MTNKCGICNAIDCRLYRPYGNFYRPNDNKCNGCLTTEQLGWYVPLICDTDGSVWGYTSMPEDSIDEFYTLSENDHNGYTWDQRSPDRIVGESFRLPKKNGAGEQNRTVTSILARS